MFTTLHALSQSATLMIVIAAEGDDLRVSVTPTQAGDKTKAHKLQPLSLVASPAELDEGFAAAIASWQAPKLSLQEQVEAANAAGTDTNAASTTKPAPKETAAKRAGPGRPRKAEAAGPAGENPAGAGADHQDGAAPTTGAAAGKDAEGITPTPAGTDAGAAAAPSTPPSADLAPRADHQDGTAPPAGDADAKEPEGITPPPVGNPAITAAVDTVTLDLF